VARAGFELDLIDFALCGTVHITRSQFKPNPFPVPEKSVGPVAFMSLDLISRDHPPREFHGVVMTYDKLRNTTETFKIWARNGVRILVVADEIHHASVNNTWGATLEELGECAVKILGMSGTPFRSDGRQISFVRYDDKDVAIPNGRYTYRDAVAEGVCRPVEFRTEDGIAEFIQGGEISETTRISEAHLNEDARTTAKVIFNPDIKWLENVIRRADKILDEYRKFDPDAGMLIVCRPGKNEYDGKHLYAVARIVQKVTGEKPEVITYDDKDASAKMERFRTSNKRCICSVRMLTEGANIPRLRVLVMACRPTTELLFRQLDGRVVRVDGSPGGATVFIAKFPELERWAKQIQEEAQAGLRKRNDPPKTTTDDLTGIDGGAGDGDGLDDSDRVIPLRASHIPAGAISVDGDAYEEAEVRAAEELQRNDPKLETLPQTTIAHLMRKMGVKPDQIPLQPEVPEEKPLHFRKAELRDELVRLLRKLAIQRVRSSMSEEEKAAIFKDVHFRVVRKYSPAKNINDLTDNYPLEATGVIDLLPQAPGCTAIDQGRGWSCGYS
jgi:superfamily II DNA or RNA helicase